MCASVPSFIFICSKKKELLVLERRKKGKEGSRDKEKKGGGEARKMGRCSVWKQDWVQGLWDLSRAFFEKKNIESILLLQIAHCPATPSPARLSQDLGRSQSPQLCCKQPQPKSQPSLVFCFEHCPELCALPQGTRPY